MVVTSVKIAATRPQVGCENLIEAVKEAAAYTTPDSRIATIWSLSLQYLLVLGSSCQVSHFQLYAHIQKHTPFGF